MPTLGLSFHFFERGELRTLVVETVRRELAGRTPQQLARFLPPESFAIEHISLRLPESHIRSVTDEGPALTCPDRPGYRAPRIRKRFPTSGNVIERFAI